MATSAGLALRANGYWLSITEATSPLQSDDLRALTLDMSGRIWIETAADGISILAPKGTGNGGWTAQTVADGLPAGTYTAQITVSAPGSQGTPQVIDVRFTIVAGAGTSGLYLPLIRQ